MGNVGLVGLLRILSPCCERHYCNVRAHAPTDTSGSFHVGIGEGLEGQVLEVDDWATLETVSSAFLL